MSDMRRIHGHRRLKGDRRPKDEEIDYGISCKKCKKKGYVKCCCDKSLKITEELAIRAVKAFPDLFPDAWEHDCTGEPFCIKCSGEDKFEYRISFSGKCTVPDPIDINDWNVAMMLFREAVEPMDVTEKEKAFYEYRRLLFRAEPKDLIEAACIAKEAENEAM